MYWNGMSKKKTRMHFSINAHIGAVRGGSMSECLIFAHENSSPSPDLLPKSIPKKKLNHHLIRNVQFFVCACTERNDFTEINWL